ncbi:MAG: PKD domain-containing protein, partial [Cyclobacteriaceae bacterium]
MKELRMKKHTNSNKISLLLSYLIAFGIGSLVLISCEEDLPEAGSIADETPPTAGFSYSASSESNLVVNFSNLSNSATTYLWDFGDGNTSTEKEPSNAYSEFGTYNVTLTSSDNLGVTSTVTDEVLVVAGPFQPVVSESGFEDGGARAAACGDGLDGRDCWRNSALGGVIQITSSPVRSGEQAAKLTGSAADQRIGYQLVTVEADQNYDLNFFYTLLNDKVGYLTVSVLSGPAASHEEALAKTIGSITVNDQTDPAAYVGATVSFNSGTSTEVAIYFFNEGSVEARLDDFSIDIGQEGAVPPSASFTFTQSEENFLEYSFTNGSVNAESYMWDFGDGNTSTEESPTHTYAAADEYTVSLTATNGIGTAVDFSTTVDIQAPVTAAFTFEVDGDDYKTYKFTDASEGAVSLLWEFGDGFQFTGMNPTHTYDEDGIYTVKLTATSITGLENVTDQQITVAAGFIVRVLNGTFDEYTSNTGDNADAWDMTPNSTVEDNNGNTIPSPYRPLWNNSDLNDYIDDTYCTNEQVGSTSDGNGGTRGAKIGNSCRRLYQVVEVQSGVEYNFSIDTRSEAAGINTEVFILNTEISDENGIDASTSDPAIDKYFDIT